LYRINGALIPHRASPVCPVATQPYERAFFRQSLTDHDYQGRPIKTVEQSVINGAKTGKVVGAIAGTLLGTLII